MNLYRWLKPARFKYRASGTTPSFTALPMELNTHNNMDSAPKTVFMFSGQGSQYFQMGKELFNKNDTFRTWMVRLDEIARRLAGRSVIETLYSEAHRKADRFDCTLLTHPAIFMVEYSLAQTLMQAGL